MFSGKYLTALIALFLGAIILFQKYQYDDLNEKYIVLQTENLSLQVNITTLENAIEKQNTLIDEYKAKSLSFEKEISSLNEKILKDNQKKVILETMEKVDSSAEEAIQWMQRKSSSLLRP